MKPRVILIFLLPLVLVFGISLALFNGSILSTESFSAEVIKKNKGTYTVILDEDGFTPESLTVPRGSTIRFTNERDRAFWPASDNHPTHNIKSEFDPRKPIPKNESWSFTFNEEGVWKYHDHLAPYLTGKIKVGENTDENCQPGYECWRQELINLMQDQGVEEAYDRIAELYKEKPSFKRNCHALAHDIGIKAYPIYQEEGIEDILTPKASYCANGFYHGLMEGFFGETQDPLAAREFCFEIRERLTDVSPDAALQCFHGIGHGVMETAFLAPNLQGSFSNEGELVDYAMNMCEEAASSSQQLYRCSSGAFNAIANYYTYDNSYGLEFNPDDPFKICRSQPEKYKVPCYGNLNTVLEYIGSLSESTRFIKEIEDDFVATTTMKYLSGIYMDDFGASDPERAIRACREAGDRLHISCIEGFTHGFLEHGTPGEEYQDALNFCKNPMMTNEESLTCWKYVLSKLQGWYSEEKARNVCESIKEPYTEYKKFCEVKINAPG